MSKELYVRTEDNTGRISYLIKEFLSKNEEYTLVSSYMGAGTVARVCNYLADQKYVNIIDVQTKTEIRDGKRKINFLTKLTKTKEFDKLYEEDLKRRQEKEERRNQLKPEPTPQN